MHVIVEYRRNADGKQVKVTRRIKRTLINTKVNHNVAERKTWPKFGLEKNSQPGPNSGTTSIGANVQVKLVAGASKEPEPDPTEAMREKLANKRVQCRLCKGDHYTARCLIETHLKLFPALVATFQTATQSPLQLLPAFPSRARELQRQAR